LSILSILSIFVTRSSRARLRYRAYSRTRPILSRSADIAEAGFVSGGA
jgi:hypothetical protein